MSSTNETLITMIKECINSELECYQILSQKLPSPVQKYFLQETQESIKRNQEILKQLQMPKLSINCVFKSANRLFKVLKQGANEGEYCWYISEMEEVNEGGKKHLRTISGLFSKSKKEMNEFVKQGKVIVV